MNRILLIINKQFLSKHDKKDRITEIMVVEWPKTSKELFFLEQITLFPPLFRDS